MACTALQPLVGIRNPGLQAPGIRYQLVLGPRKVMNHVQLSSRTRLGVLELNDLKNLSESVTVNQRTHACNRIYQQP